LSLTSLSLIFPLKKINNFQFGIKQRKRNSISRRIKKTEIQSEDALVFIKTAATMGIKSYIIETEIIPNTLFDNTDFLFIPCSYLPEIFILNFIYFYY